MIEDLKRKWMKLRLGLPFKDWLVKCAGDPTQWTPKKKRKKHHMKRRWL